MAPAARGAPQKASSGGKESQPLIGAQRAPSSTGRPSPRFLGLFLWQWGLVALGAVCLYGLYLVGAAVAWQHGGQKYHLVALTLGCISGVRVPDVQRDAARAKRARRRCQRRVAHQKCFWVVMLYLCARHASPLGEPHARHTRQIVRVLQQAVYALTRGRGGARARRPGVSCK